MGRIIDLTMPIEEHLRWPVERKLTGDFAAGDQFQVTWMFQKVIHFTDWVVGHAHMIMFGTFTFWMFGVIDWLWPRVVRREWHSNSLRSWHFWLSTIGVAIMFLDLTASGLIAGSMQRELNHWSEIVTVSVPVEDAEESNRIR